MAIEIEPARKITPVSDGSFPGATRIQTVSFKKDADPSRAGEVCAACSIPGRDKVRSQTAFMQANLLQPEY
jgi:hypothetical protein